MSDTVPTCTRGSLLYPDYLIYMSDILYKLCSLTCDKLLYNKLFFSLLSRSAALTQTTGEGQFCTVLAAPSDDPGATQHLSSPVSLRVRLWHVWPLTCFLTKYLAWIKLAGGVTVITCATRRGGKTHRNMFMLQDGRTARKRARAGSCDVT